MTVCSQYRNIGKLLARYWSVYGGWEALYKSAYFHGSLLLLALTSKLWLQKAWWDSVLSITPSLLGFTLGGFAIFLAIGDERFKATISGSDPDEGNTPSPYLVVCTTFLHFVLIEFLALLAALVSKGIYAWSPVGELPSGVVTLLATARIIGWAVAYWLFLYGLMLIAAAALATFRLANWYEHYQTLQKQNDAANDS